MSARHTKVVRDTDTGADAVRSSRLDPETSWASAQTGIQVQYRCVLAGAPTELASSVGLALRRNPKRAQLLVSTVLGKHVPVPAALCLAAGAHLGQEVARVASAHGVSTAELDVIGFAETATGLGHQVAAALEGSRYIHTTRRPAPGAARLDFLEEHSHATDQVLTPPADWLRQRAVVLVDDEMTTGRTAMNAVATLRGLGYGLVILASLLDTRGEADRAVCAQRAAELGVALANAAVLTGTVSVPPTAAAATIALTDRYGEPAAHPAGALALGARYFTLGCRGAATDGRVGWDGAAEARLQRLAADGSAALAAHAPGRVLVVGDEELMYLPQLLAAQLGGLTATTTRSPALALPASLTGGRYPLGHAVRFAAISDPSRVATAYNSAAPGAADAIVLVTEDPSAHHVRAGAVAALSSGGAAVLTVTLDRTAPFGALKEIS